MFRRTSLVLLAALIAASLPRTFAQDVEIDLAGSVGWELVGKRKVNLRAESVASNLDVQSGSLLLTVWATSEMYDGGDLFGDPIGTLRLRPLPAFSYYTNIDVLVRYTRPQTPGLYYTTMTVEEFLSDGYYIQDYVNFEGLVNLGGFGEGSTTAAGDNMDVHFAGEVTWLAGNNKVILDVDQIVNERGTKSGPLRVVIYATRERYEGGDLFNAFLLAKKSVGKLKPGTTKDNILKRVRFRPPPGGFEYFITITLEEFHRGWFIVDHVTFPGTSLF